MFIRSQFTQNRHMCTSSHALYFILQKKQTCTQRRASKHTSCVSSSPNASLEMLPVAQTHHTWLLLRLSGQNDGEGQVRQSCHSVFVCVCLRVCNEVCLRGTVTECQNKYKVPQRHLIRLWPVSLSVCFPVFLPEFPTTEPSRSLFV